MTELAAEHGRILLDREVGERDARGGSGRGKGLEVEDEAICPVERPTRLETLTK